MVAEIVPSQVVAKDCKKVWNRLPGNHPEKAAAAAAADTPVMHSVGGPGARVGFSGAVHSAQFGICQQHRNGSTQSVWPQDHIDLSPREGILGHHSKT